MSQKTRTFTVGHVEVFQDKQSEETRKILQYMDKNVYNKTRLNILDQKSGMFHVDNLAQILSEKTDAEIGTVLSYLMTEIKTIKNNKKQDAKTK